MDKCQEWARNFFNPVTVAETLREINPHPRPILYGLLVVILVGWLAKSAIQKFKRPTIHRPSTPDLEKPAARTSGKVKAPERQPGGRILARTVH